MTHDMVPVLDSMTTDRERKRTISREAARKRRKVESEVFGDLSRLLPLPASVRAHLDKPSVLRLTISYTRVRTLLTGVAGTGPSACQMINYRGLGDCGEKEHHLEKREQEERQKKKKKKKEKEEVKAWEVMGETDLYLRMLEGFFMVVSTDGDMVFLSDNVTKYTGLTQVELMGRNIYEFTHPCDHEEIRNNLCLSAGDRWLGAERDFVMRMKSTMTHRGRTTNLRSAVWKVLRCQGRVKVCMSPSSLSCLLLICQALPLSHRLVSTHTFTSQHSMDMRFIQCDQRVTLLLGYNSVELRGRSLYNLCHTLDTNRLTKSHVNLLSMGQSVSQYRMLARGGGYIWVECHSAVVPSVCSSRSNPSPHQPFCILCITYVLSGVEEPSLKFSLDQII